MERLKRHTVQIMIFLFLPVGVMLSEEKVPELVDAPPKYEARVNGSVCLPCKVKSQSEYPSEKVLFYWSKDNSTIWSWPRYRVKMNRCLRIRGIIPSDAGSYVCNAHNKYGKTSVVRKLIVIGDERRDLPNGGGKTVPPRTRITVPPPHFLKGDRLKATADLVETSVFIGRKGKLKCAVEGSPPPKITWFKDGIQVKNSNKTSIKEKTFILVIKDFQKSDVGKYTCSAENIANKVNMSVIVTAKVRQVIKLPQTMTISQNVRNGMNLTLSCRAPADQVKLMQWHIPHYTPRPDTAGRSVFRDLGRDFKRAREVLEPVVINKSRVETFKVNNISKKLHEGTYKCLVLYKSRKIPYPVKIVHVNFVEDKKPKGPLTHEVTGDSTLVLFIGIPVFAGVLSMVMVLICIRCYRYHQKKSLRLHSSGSPFNTRINVCDEEDALSMQVLPVSYPTDSLRLNKDTIEVGDSKLCRLNSTEKTKSSRSNSLDRKERKSPSNSGSLKRTNSCVSEREGNGNSHLCNSSTINPNPEQDALSTKGSIEDNRSLAKSIKSTSKDELSHKGNGTQEPIWPGDKLEPGDEDYIDFEEDQKLLCRSKCSNGKENSSKHYLIETHLPNGMFDKRHKRKEKRNKIRQEEYSVSLVENVLDVLPPSVEVTNKSISHVGMPESPEDDDLLLQREMKNWEPLIRNSSRMKDGGGNRSALLTSRCAEQVQQHESKSQRDYNIHIVH